MTRADEAARYREAAHKILDQLDWCVHYLERNHKDRLSRQLAANMAKIRQRVDEPGPHETLTDDEAG